MVNKGGNDKTGMADSIPDLYSPVAVGNIGVSVRTALINHCDALNNRRPISAITASAVFIDAVVFVM